jgi:hypothetical protein
LALAAAGLALCASVTPGAVAKPGRGRVAAHAGALVWDNSALKSAPLGLPAASAPLGTSPLASPPALGGYMRVSSGDIANPAGQQTMGSVSCPAGTVAFGGGVDGNGGLYQSIDGSIPHVSNGVAVGWYGWIDNTGGTDSSFSVHAVCAKKPRQYAVAAFSFTNPAGQQTGASVQCPLNSKGKRMKVLGGGGVGSATSPGQDINSSYPVGGNSMAWVLFENNSLAVDLPATVDVICGPAKGWSIVQGEPVDNPPGSQDGAAAICAAGHVGLSGGLDSTIDSTLVNLNTTYPPANPLYWDVFENNAGGNDEQITPYEICVFS